MVNAANSNPDVLHLYYNDVVAKPMAAVRKLYRHCEFDLSEIAEQKMAAFLEQPRRRSDRHYDLAEFGLDAEALREHFAGYVQHFAVPREADSR
jgi:hypothetical protein